MGDFICYYWEIVYLWWDYINDNEMITQEQIGRSYRFSMGMYFLEKYTGFET